jgi:VWFA-related protein
MRRPSALGLLAVLALAVQSRAQVPVYSSRVEGIRVDVLVTEGGRPVRGLRAQDFELLDNGVPQQVEVVSADDAPITVVMSLDVSESVRGTRLAGLREAGNALIDRLGTTDRVALVTFSDAVTLDAPLTASHDEVRAALGQADGGGGTALVDGAFAAIGLGGPDAGRSLLVVFSDGIDTSSWLAPAETLEAAREGNFVIYAVSSGAAPRAFLRDLTGATGGQLFTEPRRERLAESFTAILDEFRQRYLLTYTPRGVSRDGWHRLDVKVNRRGTKVQARPGYVF